MIFPIRIQKRTPIALLLWFLSIYCLSVFVGRFPLYCYGMMMSEDHNFVSKQSASTFTIIIIRNEARLYFYRDKELIKTFVVAVGNDDTGKTTPAGHFTIVNKVKDPVMVWRSGKIIPPNDPRNSYGTRWMGLADKATGKYRGCGIQGTNVEKSIGKHITVGCVRMYNDDIIELFERVDLGTEVIVR